MLIYDKLFKLLEENGYNTYKLKKTGLMSQATYQALKNGRGGLNVSTIDKLCEAFNCQPCDLMEWVPDAPKEKEQGQANAYPFTSTQTP